jgi:hypothetical protein
MSVGLAFEMFHMTFIKYMFLRWDPTCYGSANECIECQRMYHEKYVLGLSGHDRGRYLHLIPLQAAVFSSIISRPLHSLLPAHPDHHPR